MQQLEWFNRWLKTPSDRDKEESSEAAAVLHIFVMGANIWREEHEWPLARARMTPLYLTSAGRANSSSGDGQSGMAASARFAG